MKTYKINSDKAGKIGKQIASQLLPGKAGEILIRNGCTQDNYAHFIADVAHRSVNAGHDIAKTAAIFKQLAACNASQAKQALADVEITVDDLKPQSLGSFFAKTDGGPVVDLSSLGEL